MKSLARVETSRFLLVAILTVDVAAVCGILDRLTWQHSRSVSHIFDLAALILF